MMSIRSAALVALCGGCFVDAVGAGSDQPGAGGQGGDAADTSATTAAVTGGGGETATGGGSTTTGMGGEGGCTAGCEIVSSDTCLDAEAVELPAGGTVTWSGVTVGTADDVTVAGIAGLTCPSDGPDVWAAIRATAPGAIQFSLTLGPDPGWGAMLDKGSLQVRTACDGAAPGEVLACKQTAMGQARTQVFAREGDVFYVGVDGKGNNDAGSFDLEIRHSTCGNGVVDPLEQCDSGPTPSSSCSGCLSTAAQDSCGDDDADTFSIWNASTSRCYVLETGAGALNFFDAREQCVELGGDLVSFELAGEDLLFNLTYSLTEAWVGIEDFEKDGVYDWLAGGIFSGPWAPNQPDSSDAKPRCAFMLDDMLVGAYADDVACDTKLGEYVCELRGNNP